MRSSLGLLLFAIAAACAPAGRTSPAGAVDRDEAAVYAVVIDSVLASAEAPFVVMAESTMVLMVTRDWLEAYVRPLDPAFPESPITDFEARNRAPVAIPPRLSTRTPVRRLRLGTFNPSGGDHDEAYAKLRTEHAPAIHLYALSRPGFDPERRHAVIATAAGCGGLCGEGQVVLLERGPGGWRVTARVTTWES